MVEYVVETEGLTKRFGNQIGVNQLYLHVPKGKIYGLLGQNGAGKTTVMKMLLRLIRPSSGKMILFGKECVKSTDKNYRRIGSFIETPGFYENLTAWENLEILARLRGRHRKDTVERALFSVGLEKETKKAFGTFSLGMKQRLGIAAALMHEPELLILDEPMNGLDPIGICKIRNDLQQLSKEKGTTILLSSHILSEIEQLADLVGVMQKGNLLEEMDLDELRRQNRSYVEFEVSNVNSSALILERQFQIFDYMVVNSSRLRIFEQMDKRAEINHCFVENGIIVTAISVCEEKLEDYFAERIGVMNQGKGEWEKREQKGSWR